MNFQLNSSRSSSFFRHFGLIVILVDSFLLSLCCYLRFAYPRATAEEIYFALKAPAGELAFAYIQPILFYFVAPLIVLIIISIGAWKLLRTRWIALLCVLLTVGAFFFVRYHRTLFQ